MDAALPLINCWRLTGPSLVGSLPIFGRIGVRKSARTPSMLVVALAMKYCALVGIDGGFILWDNSSNKLKR